MEPLATLDLRAFVPAKDFELSKAFYEALGFTKTWEDRGMAEFRIGSNRFFLQNYYHEGWAKNCMLNLVVEDVSAWQSHIRAAGLAERFPASRPASRRCNKRVPFSICTIPRACSGTSNSCHRRRDNPPLRRTRMWYAHSREPDVRRPLDGFTLCGQPHDDFPTHRQSPRSRPARPGHPGVIGVLPTAGVRTDAVLPDAADPKWAEVKRDGVTLRFHSEPPHGTPTPPVCSGTFYIFPDDVEALAAEWRGRVEFAWGTRGHGLRDPRVRRSRPGRLPHRVRRART
jgi:hypothetical protein